MKQTLLHLFLLPISVTAVGALNFAQPSEDACKPARSSCSFYKCLDANYNGCGVDGYPLGYGYKYCRLFAQHRSDFDARGRRWILDTRLCLQQALVADSTNATETCGQLKDRAFSTHAKCYVDSGFCELSVKDRVAIAEVGKEEFLKFDGEVEKLLAETLLLCAERASGSNGVD